MRLDRVLHLVTCHAEGVVTDVVVGGLPRIPGNTMLEKKHYFEQHLDHLRTMLVLEPRGHQTRSVNLIVPSTDPRAEFGVLILETEEIADMSGGNTLGVSTVLLETGLVEMREPVTQFNLDTPAGLIGISARCRDGKVLDVTFTNQPAFLLLQDAVIDVPKVGDLRVDVAWGGMWYVIVDADDVGLQIAPVWHDETVRWGEAIKAAARAQLEVLHPVDPALGRPDVGGIQCTLLAGPLEDSADGSLFSKNAVVVSPGWIDRCPCGTGTSARLALLSRRGHIAVGQKLVHQSIIGTTFVSEIVERTWVAGLPAVIPRITGRAWITGTSQVGVDPTDPFPAGFSMGTLASADMP